MKFDVRTDASPERKKTFVRWLTCETVSVFQRSASDPTALKSAVFLFVNRCREAGLAGPAIAEIIGVSIARANLSKEEEELVLDWAEALDPLATAFNSGQSRRKPWWNFWS